MARISSVGCKAGLGSGVVLGVASLASVITGIALTAVGDARSAFLKRIGIYTMAAGFAVAPVSLVMLGAGWVCGVYGDI